MNHNRESTLPVLLGFFGVILLFSWLYSDVLVRLAQQWWDEEDYSHGFLVPLVSLYCVWERRNLLGRERLAGTPAGLIVLLFGILLLLLGSLAAELFTMRISLIVTLSGITLYLLGFPQLKILAFPILYLLFMIPPPTIIFNVIAFPLQLFSASVAAKTLQFVGIPVLREGNLITLAHSSLEVAEACSGIRSLLSLIALATAYVYFLRRGSFHGIVLILAAVPVAILTNAARVVGTGFLAHHFGTSVAAGFFHSFSGWLVFVVAFALLVSADRLLVALSEAAKSLAQVMASRKVGA